MSVPTDIESPVRDTTEPPSQPIPDNRTASPPQYEYNPLKYTDSIRILFIPPGPPSQETIHVGLYEFELDDPELVYNALSYTWQAGDAVEIDDDMKIYDQVKTADGAETNDGAKTGDGVKTEDGVKTDDGEKTLSGQPPAQLLCFGALLDVSQNCYKAIRRLRHASDLRVFWVDAVCIDQTNDAEKSAQVSLMRRIYSQAGTVQIWLGDASPELDPETSTPLSDLGMDFIYDFAVEIDERSSAGLDVAGGALYREFIGPRMEFHRHNTGALTPRVRGLYGILRRPWWERLWTVQELALAKEVYFVLGDKVQPFNNLGLVFETLLRPRDGQPAEEYEYNCFFIAPASAKFSMHNYLRTERCSVPRGPGERALDVMQATRNAVATDPRDKIYGVLGFFGDRGDDPHNIFPAPDYTRTAAELYAEVTRALVTTTGSLDVISSCQGFLASSVPDLPSWAVSWNDTPLEPFGVGSFDAAGGSRVACEDAGDHRLLRLRGRRVDRVTYELGSYSNLTYSDESAAILWFYWHRLAFSRPPYPTGESMEDVFLSTLCWGSNVRKGRLRPGDYREAFDAWVEILLSEGDISSGDWKSVARRIFRDERTFTLSRRAHSAMIGRTMGTTEKDYLTMLPVGVKVGDEIVVLDGSKVPFVIQAQGDGYKLVGACYVHGIMDGEAVAEGGEAGASEWFTLC
ncbi:HET domain-containing protein [Candidatus Bathyarchaeota archaeon]|nr:HET domain-containing protein [Candidatus Bathyarchaeota archaeon]